VDALEEGSSHRHPDNPWLRVVDNKMGQADKEVRRQEYRVYGNFCRGVILFDWRKGRREVEGKEDKKWVDGRAKDQKTTGWEEVSKSTVDKAYSFRGKRHDQTRLMSNMLDTASPVGARVQLRLQAAGCSSSGSRKYMHNMA